MKKIMICLLILFSLQINMITIPSQGLDNASQISSNYDMVIICPPDFTSVIQPLIDHKNQVGIKTTFVTTTEIYQRYNGRDYAEQIKFFIKDMMEQFHIKYVLLLGDIQYIPIRKSAVTWDYFGSIVVQDVITDYYYEDIYDINKSFSSWDSNNNDIFSEVQMITRDMEDNETFHYIDTIDLIPDVNVGRLPCSSIKEVELSINKIITYETETYGSEWFNRIILIGGDTFPNIGDMSEGEFVTDSISAIMHEFESIKLWTSLGTYSPLKINKEINKGAGFLTYSGHGFQYGFGTSAFNDNKLRYYYTPYIFGIQNNIKYPIMYFDACLTASLDYSLYNQNIPCFAWALAKKPFGGAIACIGSTRVGYGGFEGDPLGAGSPCLNYLFFKSYSPGITISEMFTQAKRKYIEEVWIEGFQDCLTLQEFILIGDPSLKIGGYYN